jgi:hypothetical protein
VNVCPSFRPSICPCDVAEDLSVCASVGQGRADTLSNAFNDKGYLEELVVRRELADNFVFYEPNYDSLAGGLQWARETLQVHRDDKREHVYTR